MDLLEKLLTAFGVSGNEQDIRKIIKNAIKPYVDKIYVDKLGNLIARKRGDSPKVMISAHMDEIGLMAKSIDERGKIYCSMIGGIDPITVLGEKVHIQTKKGVIHGVVSTKEISNGNLVNEVPKVEELIVDTGLTKKELRSKGVETGSFLSLEKEVSYLGSEKIICGKAFDDRIGCYILIELAKILKKKAKNEINYVFTTQEEVGLFGAITSAYQIEPDWAVVVDVCEADDSSERPTRTLGMGPCITVKDSDMIGNKCIIDWIKEIAKKHNIHYQIDVSDFGTTEALSISISKGGVPSSVICVPIRNLHTATSIAHKSDIENTIKLLEEILKKAPSVCLVK